MWGGHDLIRQQVGIDLATRYLKERLSGWTHWKKQWVVALESLFMSVCGSRGCLQYSSRHWEFRKQNHSERVWIEINATNKPSPRVNCYHVCFGGNMKQMDMLVRS